MEPGYYEYGDDLIARVGPDGRGFDIWVKGKWVRCNKFVKFADTAQKIDDIQAYVSQNPDSAAAFSA